LGTTKIDVPPFCSIKLVNNTTVSDGNIWVSPEHFIFQWVFQPPLLPSELLATASHVDKELNNLKSNISNFRHFANQTMSDDQFSKMLINHVTSYNHTSIFIWLFFASTFLAILVSTICTCLICNANASFAVAMILSSSSTCQSQPMPTKPR
jgi:hypothetical protein